MATDWAFYYLTRPLGLLVIALLVAMPFGIWRLLMGKSFARFGLKPLGAGYLAAAIGLTLFHFASSYIEFSRRVEAGILEESARWSTVPWWTVYVGVLSLMFVLPVLGLLAVPISAFLLKAGKLSYKAILIVCLSFWLLMVLAMWLTPTNQWHETHRFESLQMIGLELLPGVVAIGMPFLLAVLLVGRRQHAET